MFFGKRPSKHAFFRSLQSPSPMLLAIGTAKAMPSYKATAWPARSIKHLSKLDIHLPKMP
jgi:hypothetical protein